MCKMSVDSISTVKDEKLDAEIYFRGNISMCNSQLNEQLTSSFLRKIINFPIIICVLKTRKDKKLSILVKSMGLRENYEFYHVVIVKSVPCLL